MAEAVVEDRPGPPPRFYCHVCKQEFTDITQEYTCPICSDGFIEELHDADPSPSSGPANMEVDVLELLNTGFREGLSAEGAGPGRVGHRSLRRPHHHQHHHHHHHHHPPRMGPPTHPAADGSPAPAMVNAYDQLIRDFFAYVGVPAGGGGANGRRLISAAGPGRADVTLTPMFFVGNPGDYVWGHDGLDSVITLMLNQLEPTGPPPMSAQKIDEIPKCEIGRDELDKKMQCSVCLEDFQMQEQCRKLPCAHIFHETCILPWLELHGTCPICRDTFAEGQEEDGNRTDEAMDTDAQPSNTGTGTGANSFVHFENFLSDMQRPGGMMNVFASHLPRTGSSSNPASGGAGVIGSAPSGSDNSSSTLASSNSTGVTSNSSSHMSSNAISSQSENTNNNANEANFHLDDGLD